MAAARTVAAAHRRAIATLAALLSLISAAHPAAPSPLDGRGGVAASEGDRTLAEGAAVAAARGDSALAAAAVAPVPVFSGPPGTGFTLRRAPNPRYRPPVAGVPGLAPGTAGPLRSMDRVHVRLTRHGSGTSASREWDAGLGQLYRRGDAVELSASGSQSARGSDLRSLRLDARRDRLSGSLGDLPAAALEPMASLQRLRGGALAIELPGGARVRALGGVPTPIPGSGRAPIAVGGAALDALPFDEGVIALGVIGFHRGRARWQGPGLADLDSLAGGGAMGSFGVIAPLPLGRLGLTVAGGWHDLDGHGGLAAQQALDWSWATPRAALALHDERSTRRTRRIGTETLAPAAREEQRWNAQVRGARGRVEAHVTGAVRAGGDSSLAARTLQAGASGSLPGSPWYSGLEFSSSGRGATGVTERRLSLHAGEVLPAGHALLFRLERSTNTVGRDAVSLANETSLALRHGLRLSLEPRATWSQQRLEQSQMGGRLSWPLAWLSARLTGAVVVGATRDRGFRAGVNEAELSMVFVPRPRDRAEAEVRRLAENGVAAWEYGASYDLEAPRYEGGGGWLGRRDSSRVTVRVQRTGNHAGLADVLVTMDGKDLRFTDADGVARFERVTPGIHVVAIEERTLPANHQVVSFSRVFVTVERGRIPDDVTFEIARPSRKSTF